ncbi:hypothetical protein [Acetivibrio cellulolyticus]|uniref:hypothetical protein n=1 Tax=Acetivibrio cellulolyticus TaxID=35830 RepID=UPI0001E2FB71|nr:hypothetical protein [Acetivibrio cellulolyticus]
MICNLQTRYGIISGVSYCEYYEDNIIKECTLNTFNQIKTNYGVLTPQFDDSKDRKKFTNSISYYKSGALKSISLNNQTYIKTSTGTFPAELLTFYESGSIKRLFPLNGKITGYWDENDEYNISPLLDLNLGFGKIKTKVISIYFYESGNIKGLTLWSKDSLTVPLPFGEVSVRIGITFYEDGTVSSFEPSVPTSLNTKIGRIIAYNTLASGINGDLNSVNINKDGTIESLMTSTNKIIGTTSKGKKLCFGPKLKPNPLILGKSELVPLIIEFNKNRVLFNNKYKYKISNCVFEVTESTLIDELVSCGKNCSTCSGCH